MACGSKTFIEEKNVLQVAECHVVWVDSFRLLTTSISVLVNFLFYSVSKYSITLRIFIISDLDPRSTLIVPFV